jgi:pyruvate/2-oxoglutarate dehydrogenase complex dihydrolipoamide dehydrogenase (E3) component
MPRAEFDLVVIGGGAGGLVVAAGGAKLGAKVALVEKHRLGGDCLWHGCVPSKTLLKAAKVAHDARHGDRFGLPVVHTVPDVARVMQHVAAVIAGIAPNDSPERFRALGVDVVLGDGRFVSPHAFVVGGRTLTARHFVVATGTRPALPPIPGLREVRCLTNETVFDLREPVPHLAVVGAGAVGCELAQAFARLGSAVTVIDVAPRILASEDHDLAEVVRDRLVADGVRFRLSATIGRVERDGPGIRVALSSPEGEEALACSHLLVAAGRIPNVEALDLTRAGIEIHDGRIRHDALRTANPRIHVVGDVAGGGYTHVAEHHAGIVLRRTLFHQRWARPSAVIPRCTFTDPELAQVGLSETRARAGNVPHRAFVVPFGEIDRARTDVETDGFAKLVASPRGRLLGVGIVGAHAGELIAEMTLAISASMKAADVSAAIHAYPTLAQVNRRLADQPRNAKLTPRAKALVRWLFRLRGA